VLPTVFPHNRLRTAAALLGSLVFVVLGGWLLASRSNVVVLAFSTITVAFFGVGVFVSAKRLIDPEPDLVITDEGFKAVTTAPISWAEVLHVTARPMPAGRTTRNVIEVVLRDPAAYVARTTGTIRMAARANLAAGFSPAYVTEVGRGVSLDEIMIAMLAHHPALTVLR
jgi:hypothetical protein